MKKYIIYGLIALSVLIAACGTTTKTSTEKEIVKTVEKTSEKVNKDSNKSDDKIIYQGEFHDADKTGSGTASVYENEDGKRILRLTNFKTNKGPDLYVYVFKAKDANDAASLKDVEYVSLGRLKSETGDQEYEVPASLNLEQFQAVSIWCEEFTVNFSVAPLSKKA